MIFVAIYTGLRVSELAGLRWNDLGDNTITIDERYCRGDWGAPKSESSNATIPVKECVIERIHRLKLLTVHVKAGRAVRKYKVVKADGPNDLIFQSVRDGKPLRDNNILVRFIKPAGRGLGLDWVNWRCCEPPCHLAQDCRRGREGRAGANATLASLDNARHLSAVRSGITAPRGRSTRQRFQRVQ